MVAPDHPLPAPTAAKIGEESPSVKPVETEVAGVAPCVSGFQSLAPAMIRMEIIAGVIFCVFVLIGLLVGLLVLWMNVGTGWILAVASLVGGVLFVILLAAALFWPAIDYRHTQWKLDDEGLEIHRGVLWRQRISVPLGRVQHADVSQGPLQRPFGLGKLIVNTAGTQNASVALDGLDHDVALSLRDRLVRQTRSQDVT